MRDLETELKSLKLFGMAAGYAEVASQGGPVYNPPSGYFGIY
jgi:hypothetical protein